MPSPRRPLDGSRPTVRRRGPRRRRLLSLLAVLVALTVAPPALIAGAELLQQAVSTTSQTGTAP